MTTYYSEYTEIALSPYFSDPTEINLNAFSSLPTEIFLSYYSSLPFEITLYLGAPGGILTWTKASNLSSTTNACRLHRTVEAGIPMGNTSSVISRGVNYVFEKIYGSDVFTPSFSNPSINITDDVFKIADVSRNINIFLEGEGRVDQRNVNLLSHVQPLKVVIGKKENSKIAIYVYFSDGQIYAFEMDDSFPFSSSSSSISIS